MKEGGEGLCIEKRVVSLPVHPPPFGSWIPVRVRSGLLAGLGFATYGSLFPEQELGLVGAPGGDGFHHLLLLAQQALLRAP